MEEFTIIQKTQEKTLFGTKEQVREDLEATENDMKGVCYTAISFLTFFIVLVTGIVYLAW